MRILVFEPNLNGHRLEYLHHLYEIAATMPENHFIFASNSSFEDKKHLLSWNDLDNVEFDLSIPLVETITKKNSMFGLLRQSYNHSRRLRKYIHIHKADRVFVNSIIFFTPCLPFFFLGNVKVSGIIYKNYLNAGKSSLLNRIINRIKYGLLAHAPVFGHVLVLNDPNGAERLNRIYRSNRFMSCPDPFMVGHNPYKENLRKDYNISESQTLLIHFGGLQARKGTMDILRSIHCLTEKERRQYVFFFAGRIYSDIRDQFYEQLEHLKDKVMVFVKDEFCDFGFIYSLCRSCDAILIPYYNVSQSSGLLGYASYFNKPVVAPNQGLIGNIVSRYELGYLLPEINDEELVKAYREVSRGNVQCPTSRYCTDNSPESFMKAVEASLS